MQQMTARELVLLAQIEVQRPLHRLGGKTQPLLLAKEILVQRHHRRRRRHVPERLADDELSRDQRERRVGATREYGARRFRELRQAATRASHRSVTRSRAVHR